MNDIVNEQQTSINQLTDEIDLKATKSEYDGLNGRVGNAETQLNLNTEAIKLTAKQTELDKTNGRLSTAEAQLTVQAGEIATKVTQEDIDESLSPLESRVGNAESTIVQHTTSIGLKANANEVYKKAEADGKVSTAITQAKGEIKIETDKISQNVTNLTTTVTTQGTTITNHETSITQMKGSIDLKAEKKDVYTKTESDGKVSTAVTQAKAEIKLTTDGITQNVTNIQGDLDTLEGTVVAQGTQIKQTSDEVAINVVKKGNVKASINASAEGVKIGGQHVDITGQVTFSTLDPTMQGKVNAGTDAKNLVDGMQFGFSNIVSKKQLSPVNVASSSYDKSTNTWTMTANSGAGGTWGAGLRIVEKTSVVPIGSWFTVSFEIYSPIDTTWNVDVNNFPVIGTSASNDNDDTALRKTSSKSLKANTWTKCWFMWKNKDNSTSDLYDQSNIGLINNSGAPVTFKMRNVKGELGNVVTDFSLAQQDVDDAIANVTVGFRNILNNTSFQKDFASWGVNGTFTRVVEIDSKLQSVKVSKLSITSANQGIFQYPVINDGILELDKEYTISYYAKSSISGKKFQSNLEGAVVSNQKIEALTTSYVKYTNVVKGTGKKSAFVFYSVDTGMDVYLHSIKVEEGTRASDWTTSTGDVDSLISDVDQKAQDSKNAIADMANDNKATPLEKQQLKKEWATVVAEKPQYEALATTYGITTEKTNYVNAYNALNTAVTPIIANTTTTSDINGATFRNTFDDYYDKKAQLIKKINELSKVVAQGLNGKVLYNDPMFKNGLNDVKVYNNSGNTNVTVTRVAKPSDAPTNSTHVLEIKALALPISPAYGGFSFQTSSRANAIFVTRIVAKIPVGSKLVFASNSTGTGGKTEWLTPVTGTGNWEEYLCRIQCGSTGTFSSTNFYNIEGGTLPLTWHVAYATVIDATDYDYSITDMANDNKLTPLEKQQLKKEWATISAEKPQYEALSNTYGITTEKTNYVNAYNALNTFITPLIANIAITSDVTGATFRATFDDYYDKKAQLIKKVNELARTIGTNADTKAQEAKNSIADMSSDSKITPVEKVQLAKEWATMVAEKPQYEALATTYGITTEKTNFVNTYNTLNTTLNGTGGILTSMTTTSTVVGATFRAQFDDYYDKMAQLTKKVNELAKSLADGAQGTANTANTTANTANNAINTNKATWDRASNINSNGTFNSSKLSGAILDAQISSAVNWNGAKSLLDSWKSGTTLINGGMIATNSIFAQQIAIGDFTNLSQINEEKNPNGYPTVLLSNKRFFKIGTAGYASLTMMDTTYVEFKVNDEYYIAFNGYRDAGVTSLNLIMRYHYTDGTWVNAGSVSALPTTADTRIVKNLKITVAPDDAKTISRVQLFLEKDGGTSGYYYIRDIEVRKRYTGELIVDGSIKVAQIDVASLFANSAFINNIKAQTISGDKVVGGKISGVTYESINASNPKIKVVIEGNTIKSYGASDGTKQNYSELKEGLIKVFEMAETGSPFGDKGTAIQPASVTVTHGGKNTKIFPFNIEFKEGTVAGNINFEGLPNGGGAGISIQADSGIQVVSANADKPALQFVNNESVIFNGWGNIVGNPYSSQWATWSIKDADGKLKFLAPVGKGGTGATEIYGGYSGIKFFWQGTHFMDFWGDATNRIMRFGGDGGMIKWWHGGKYLECKTYNESGFVPIYASAFNIGSSEVWKTDIERYEKSALDVIANTDIMTYKYKADVEESENPHTHVGLIAEYAPKEVQSKDGRAIDSYAMSSVAWKAIQELSEQVRYLKEQLNNR
ncbi:tail fiber domain-containing protein [Bacillus wiedmannii]|uniref:tail fiber domain-containing protein n=1 Tax=Bacillus wiedmannii TaxID=1890302 RepID=UPI001243D2BA|nr:tail fiber domain-containing protein [Bacillus wiedmannii]